MALGGLPTFLGLPRGRLPRRPRLPGGRPRRFAGSLTMDTAKSLVPCAISEGNAAIRFLKFSADANTLAIDAEAFLLGIFHRASLPALR